MLRWLCFCSTILFFTLGAVACGGGEDSGKARAELRRLGLEPTEAAFLQAVESGRAETVSLLLKAGIDPDSRNEEELTALMLAVRAGHVEVAQLLVESEADLNLRDPNGRTALDYASENPENGIFTSLAAAGALFGDPAGR